METENAECWQNQSACNSNWTGVANLDTGYMYYG